MLHIQLKISILGSYLAWIINTGDRESLNNINGNRHT